MGFFGHDVDAVGQTVATAADGQVVSVGGQTVIWIGHCVTVPAIGQVVTCVLHSVAEVGVMVGPHLLGITGHWVSLVCGQTVTTVGHWVSAGVTGQTVAVSGQCVC